MDTISLKKGDLIKAGVYGYLYITDNVSGRTDNVWVSEKGSDLKTGYGHFLRKDLIEAIRKGRTFYPVSYDEGNRFVIRVNDPIMQDNLKYMPYEDPIMDDWLRYKSYSPD